MGGWGNGVTFGPSGSAGDLPMSGRGGYSRPSDCFAAGRDGGLFGAVSAAACVAAPSPTIDEIVARYVAARGGLSKIRSVQTLRQQGHATAGADRRALVTRELKRPGRTRFEFTVQGVTTMSLSTASMAGIAVRGRHGPQGAARRGGAGGGRAGGHRRTARRLEGQGTPGGDRRPGGRRGWEAYKLKLTLKSGAVRYEYLDVKSVLSGPDRLHATGAWAGGADPDHLRRAQEDGGGALLG